MNCTFVHAQNAWSQKMVRTKQKDRFCRSYLVKSDLVEMFFWGTRDLYFCITLVLMHWPFGKGPVPHFHQTPSTGVSPGVKRLSTAPRSFGKSENGKCWHQCLGKDIWPKKTPGDLLWPSWSDGIRDLVLCVCVCFLFGWFFLEIKWNDFWRKSSHSTPNYTTFIVVFYVDDPNHWS